MGYSEAKKVGGFCPRCNAKAVLRELAKASADSIPAAQPPLGARLPGNDVLKQALLEVPRQCSRRQAQARRADIGVWGDPTVPAVERLSGQPWLRTRVGAPRVDQGTPQSGRCWLDARSC